MKYQKKIQSHAPLTVSVSDKLKQPGIMAAAVATSAANTG